MRHPVLDPEAQRLKARLLRRLRHVHPHQRPHPFGVEPVGARVVRHGAGDHDLGRLAAGVVQDNVRGGLDPGQHARRVDPPLEAVARVGMDPERPARERGPHRVEVGALDEDVRRALVHPRRRAAHDPAEGLQARVVGDEHGAFGRLVGPLVQRVHALAARRQMHAQAAREPARVEHVQRPVEVEGEEVGHVHEEADRAQADRLQPRLEPVRRRPVADPADEAAVEDRAALAGVVVDGHADRRREGPRDRHHLLRLQRPESPRGQITRDPAHAGARRGGWG